MNLIERVLRDIERHERRRMILRNVGASLLAAIIITVIVWSALIRD